MSFQKMTLTGLTLAALSACAGQQAQPEEKPKMVPVTDPTGNLILYAPAGRKVMFDVNGNPVLMDGKGELMVAFSKTQMPEAEKQEPKPADSTNPYDVIAGKAVPKLQPKETPITVKQSNPDNSNPYDIISGTAKPKEQPKPLEQLKEPKYLPVALKASYSFEKDGFGAGAFYGIIKKNDIDMSRDKAKVLDIVLNADQQKDKVLSDKDMADYIAKNKLTVSWVRDAPVYFEIEGSYDVEEGSEKMFNTLSQKSPARVMYILGDTKRVDKKAVDDLADKLK